MILVLAVVITAVVLIVRSLGGPWQGAAPPHYPPQAAPRSTSSKSALRAARSTNTSSRNAAAYSGSEPV